MKNDLAEQKHQGECFDDYDLWDEDDDVDKYPVRPHFLSILKKELKTYKEKWIRHVSRN